MVWPMLDPSSHPSAADCRMGAAEACGGRHDGAGRPAPGPRRVGVTAYGLTTGQGVAPEEVHVTRPWIAGLMVPAAER